MADDCPARVCRRDRCRQGVYGNPVKAWNGANGGKRCDQVGTAYSVIATPVNDQRAASGASFPLLLRT